MKRLFLLSLVILAGFGSPSPGGEGPRIRLERGAASDPQDWVFLQIRSDRNRVYPMQPFTVSLTLTIRALPEPFQDQNPLAVFDAGKVRPPRLRIPWVDPQQIPEGIAPLLPSETWLEPFRSPTSSGVRINQIGERSVRAVVEKRPVTFLPPAQQVVRPDRQGIERRFWQYELSRSFQARRMAPYTFGPAIFEGELATACDAEGKLTFEPLRAIADPITITVQEIPQEGRPPSYLGAIGRFDIEAQLSSSRAKVGDPLRLELRLFGQGSLAEVVPPDLNRLPQVAEHFRVYEAVEITGADEVRFVYRLRPLHAAVEAFPAIPLSYFDSKEEKFVVLESRPIPLEVAPAAQLSPQQIVMAPQAAASVPAPGNASRGGLFPHRGDVAGLRNDALPWRPWAAALAGLLGSYFVAVLVTLRLRRHPKDEAGTRWRTAPAQARDLLRQAVAEGEAGRPSASALLLQQAFVTVIAGRWDLAAGGLTAHDLRQRLAERGVDAALLAEIAGLLEACERARFGGASESWATSAGTWSETLERLILALKPPRESALMARLRRLGKLLALTVLLGLLTGCQGSVPLDVEVRFREAQVAMDQAQTPDDFLIAAGLYQQILDRGFVSGVVLYNQGNALLQAGRRGEAIAAYRQAQRYRPRDPQLEANLNYARNNELALQSRRPWAETMLFWQGWLSRGALLHLAGGLAVAAWVLGMLHLARRRPFWGRAALVCLAAACLVVLALAYPEWRSQPGGVVVASEVTVRKGNAHGFPSVLVAPIREGTEFLLLERRDSWLRIRLAGDEEGWIEQGDAALY